MIIGCPTEVKVREYRVGIIPASASILVSEGHQVLIQKGAGVESGIPDSAYEKAGAQIVESKEEVWKKSEMIVKVKEPVAQEYDLIEPHQNLFTFLHLAAEPKLTQVLLQKKVTAIAYETIQVGTSLPILKPMSEVAGRMAAQVGAYCLEKPHGGRGLLLGGVTGVSRGKVTIIGGGVVGTNAAKIAIGLGAQVCILDTNLNQLEYLDDIFHGRVQTFYSNPHNLTEAVIDSDLVIGAVLIAGAKAPRLVTRDHIAKMRKGSVIVDVAVDQGGCVETMHPTTHDDPTFIVDGVVHYGVSNMPGAVSRTSTFALANATLPYMRQLAGRGIQKSCMSDSAIGLGLNTYQGRITYRAVADALELPFVEYRDLL